MGHALRPKQKKWQVRGHRLGAYRSRLRGLMRSGGARGAHVFTAGLKSSVMCGSELGGWHPRTVQWLNADAVKAARLNAMAVPTEVSLLGLGDIRAAVAMGQGGMASARTRSLEACGHTVCKDAAAGMAGGSRRRQAGRLHGEGPGRRVGAA